MAFSYNKAIVAAEMQRIVKNSPGTQKFFKNAALAILVSEREKLIKEYQESNITQEILQGADAENISDTLGGEGNLYTFIGFDAQAENPAKQVPEYLRQNITLQDKGKYIASGKETRIEYSVIAPTQDEYEKDFPIPWDTGSWLFKISEGISGLGEYVFHKYFPSPPSRSTAGLQSKHQIREEEFSPKPYFKKMLDKFYNRLKKRASS